MERPLVRVGLEVCHEGFPSELGGARLGLLMNQASVDSDLRYACDVVAARFPGHLAAIFCPQHGLWGEEQANMIETPHGFHRRLGVPIYSLYSDTRRPTPEMLKGLDCLLVDLQDVGTRVYTFVWTMSFCLEACAEARIPVVVLDRPNPLGGEVSEGPPLDLGSASFVGRAAIPMRHGLTIGELARLLNARLPSAAELHVIPMRGWRRQMLFPETGRAWIVPSPNMPRFETAVLYPGQVLLEGTRVSEGRGTTTPFELVGAPYVEPDQLHEALRACELPGVRTRPVRFRPTFDKWQGTVCGGVSLHIVEPRAVRSYRVTLAILACLQTVYPHEFAWLPPPYEYEFDRMPIDIISGGTTLREAFAAGKTSPSDLDRLAALDELTWQRQTQPFRLYA